MQEVTTKFSVEGFPFEVKEMGIIGKVDEENRFFWAIDIYAKDGMYDDLSVSPKFSFKTLEQRNEFEFDQIFRWDKAGSYNFDTDEWVGSFYIFDGHSFDCKVSISKQSSTKFLVELNGRVNLNWETAPTTNYVPFEIVQIVPFFGVKAVESDYESAKTVIEKYLNIEDFRWNEKDQWFDPVSKP